jgi:Protein of unknown function (DUF3105)
MSMSTPHGGGNRRPTSVKPGGRPSTSTARPKRAPAPEPEAAEVEAVEDVDAVDDVDVESDTSATEADAVEEEETEETAPSARPVRSARSRSGEASAKAGDAATKTGAATKAGAGAKAGGGGAKARAAKAGSARPSTRSGARPATKASASKPGLRRIAPVKVSQGRNWGPIALFVGVALLAVGIVAFGAWKVYETNRTFEQKAAAIPGVVNYIKQNPSLKQPAQHGWGPQTYPQSPPVGGKHNPNLMNCMGDVYDAQIANEHAVHSLEHGAVWITYNPEKLSKDQIEVLAKKVRGQEYMLMSPYPGLDKPVSLQAWGYQLKVDKVDDKRIDEFIKLMRKTAGIETAQCSGGITEPGTTPRDLGKDQPQQPGQPQPGG